MKTIPRRLPRTAVMAVFASALPAHAAEVQVAVAASFAGPLGKIAEGFTAATGHVSTGNADLGFVALSQVAMTDRAAAGSYSLVPPSLYGQIRQDAVLLKAGENNPAARALLAWLKTTQAKAVMESHGYGMVRP
jgi:ABC-type molybdate transport system substrate-binding protein